MPLAKILWTMEHCSHHRLHQCATERSRKGVVVDEEITVVHCDAFWCTLWLTSDFPRW